MSEQARRPYLKLAILISVIAAGLAGVVQSGALDQLSNDGSANQRTALISIVVYWCFSMLALIVLSKIRSHWKQMLLGIFATTLCIVVAEFALRFLNPRLALPKYRIVYHADLHHVSPANEHMDFGYFHDKRVDVITNEDGFRTKYSVEEFNEVKQRIVCIGDSFTFGFGNQEGRGYPDYLESLLREEAGSDDIAVLNAGVISYSPILELKLLRRDILKYNPQTVVLMLDANDIGDDYWYDRDIERLKDARGPYGKLVRPDTLQLGAIWRLTSSIRNHEALVAPFKLMSRLMFGKSENPHYYQFEAKVGNITETNRFFIFRHPLEVTRPFFDHSWSYIKQIADECKKIDARFVLVVPPRFQHWNTEECKNNWEGYKYKLGEPHELAMFEYFDEKKLEAEFEVFSLLPQFQATDRFPLVYPGDPHWNEEGNRFVAEHVAQLLLDNQ